MPKNQKKLVYGVIALAVALGIILVALFIINHFNNQADSDNVAISVEFDDDVTSIDWSNYKTYEIDLTESLEITQPGVYVLSGEITDGCISINTDDNVKLELNNVRVSNSSGPAIYVANAKNVVIFTTQNSVNYLSDGATYNSNYETDEIGAIYSHDDLMLEGSGTLIVTSQNEDAIVSKDDLVFNGGSYQITSVDDGIRGKDSVYIQSGDFTIVSGGDGIKSTNTTETERGFIYIVDGNFDITAELDGIQAETTLQIVGGTFDIKTGGGSSITSTKEEWGTWGRMPMGQSPSSTTTDTASAKGIKATDISIEQGTFNLSCSDDALHANGDLKITDGTIKIATGDDGVHADGNLVIDGGNINITQSYEGLEGATVAINGGDIAIVASDDGINAAGGSDSSSMGRPGANNFKTDDNIYIRIRGGKIQIDATGDAIDSNSNIYIDGGDIAINGPTNGADNALDHDGELIITGGTVIANEIAGMMAGGISTSSTSYSIIATFQTTYNAGTTVTIEDSNGAEIMSLTPQKSFNSITFSSSALQKDATYTIKVNGTVYQSFTIASVVTQIGISGGMMNMGGGKASSTRPR